jgi:hypothetical protein
MFFSLFLGTLAFSFCLAYISVLSKLKKMNIAFAQMILANNMLEEYIEKEKVLSNKNEEEMHKENFIKFLSDSRDWAFTYIEDVQQGLEKFILTVEPEIIHFNKDSSAYKETNYHSFMKKISEEYKELKKLMPTESINKDA